MTLYPIRNIYKHRKQNFCVKSQEKTMCSPYNYIDDTSNNRVKACVLKKKVTIHTDG